MARAETASPWSIVHLLPVRVYHFAQRARPKPLPAISRPVDDDRDGLRREEDRQPSSRGNTSTSITRNLNIATISQINPQKHRFEHGGKGKQRAIRLTTRPSRTFRNHVERASRRNILPPDGRDHKDLSIRGLVSLINTCVYCETTRG